METIGEIARIIRTAREAKGLSQRALAKIAGVPQSHISKIENAGVDLRVSSLTQIARALDLELALVPRKAVPAVKSILRSAQPDLPSLTSLALSDDLAKLEKTADKIAEKLGSVKEAAQLQSRVHDLTRFSMPESFLSNIRELQKELDRVNRQPDLKRLIESLNSVQALRNAIAHSPAEEVRRVSRSAYSLEDDNG
ncbi:XRE family transcriptional regulator [Halieaceae bacterium IMCC8485]|uniref:XRE family transcriptional regulator n=1 Tax=Candidatus Seongchinamella marina TaxID=2518990 RepID=A0ABT3SZH1_9GAMM|nr:helix-turn-helix transcriptional regulator [Candidatus Seongchinamella marina]MCX2975402.1 XRE family transcriptional regulator [Candidatus Seongchinamella marina]